VLEWNYRSVDGRARVVATGVIDEMADMHIPIDEWGPIEFDLGGVRRINSVGVREFRSLMARLRDREIRITRCPVVMVEQANSIAGFFGAARVESLFVPMLCAPCRREHRLLVTVADYRARGVPVSSCSECGHGLELDDDEGFYFSFLGISA